MVTYVVILAVVDGYLFSENGATIPVCAGMAKRVMEMAEEDAQHTG